MVGTVSGACGLCAVPLVVSVSKFEAESVTPRHLVREERIVDDWEKVMRPLNAMRASAQQVYRMNYLCLAS